MPKSLGFWKDKLESNLAKTQVVEAEFQKACDKMVGSQVAPIDRRQFRALTLRLVSLRRKHKTLARRLAYINERIKNYKSKTALDMVLGRPIV